MKKVYLTTVALLCLSSVGCSNTPAPTASASPSQAASNAPAAVSPAMAEGQFTACKSNIKNIATALEMYSTDWSGKYVPEDRGLSLLTPNYLKTIPECPAAKSVTYSYDEGLDAELNGEAYQDYYMLRCKGGHHKVAGAEGDLPAYNGDVGLMSTNEELVAQTKVAEAARKAREAEEQ